MVSLGRGDVLDFGVVTVDEADGEIAGAARDVYALVEEFWRDKNNERSDGVRIDVVVDFFVDLIWAHLQDE